MRQISLLFLLFLLFLLSLLFLRGGTHEVAGGLDVSLAVAGTVHDRPDPAYGSGQSLAGRQVAGREHQTVLTGTTTPT
jgi:hypothetical protein